jgi:thiamine-phosphate pyrophosphorylase
MELKDGIYLVIDPSLDLTTLLAKLKSALEGGLAAVQIWDHLPEEKEDPIISSVAELCALYHVPVIINNKWSFVLKYNLAGVHFDIPPVDITSIQEKLPDSTLYGLTTNNEIESIQWAEQYGFQYISFCSMFPSSTANSCDLVEPESIHRAKQHFSGKIFASGGITHQTISNLTSLPLNGVAIVSGIMSSDDPKTAVLTYHKQYKKL